MPLTVPNTFVAHTKAEAGKVNENFNLFSQTVNIAGDTMQGTLVTQDLRPDGDALYDLGTSSVRYKDIYVSGNIVGGIPPATYFPYLGTSAPTGYLMCDGASYLTANYPALSAIIRPTLGGADGAHFYVPDMRGKFAFGKSTAGTGSTLGAAFGTIDHIHAGPGHTHSVVTSSHTHTGPSHTHSVTTNNHTHTGPSHSHFVGGVTSTESADVDVQFGSGATVAAASHSHNWSATTAAEGTEATGSAGGESLTSGAGGTGSTSSNGGEFITSGSGGTGATTSANPPGFSSNFIIKT